MNDSLEIPKTSEISENEQNNEQFLETSENEQREVSVIFCTYGHDGFCLQKVYK